MTCCRCGKKAYISLTGEGSFCCDCFNKMTEERYGIKDDFDCPKEYLVKDVAEGVTRRFELRHINFGTCTSWHATEVPEGYDIEHSSYRDEPPKRAVNGFLNAINSAVNSKTLTPNGELEMKGTAKVLWEKGETALLIDGKKISFDEFKEKLASNEGWQIQYIIKEPTDDVLKSDEVLMPVRINSDELVGELDRNIRILQKGYNFITYKDVLVFDTLFEYIYDKLAFALDTFGYCEEWLRAVDMIIERLNSLETDDDTFPENWICKLEILKNRYGKKYDSKESDEGIL